MVVSVAANSTVPEGIVTPAKSVAVARFVPLPVTAQKTLDVPVLSPLRVTVNVKGVEPTPVPSGLLADKAPITNVGGWSSF